MNDFEKSFDKALASASSGSKKSSGVDLGNLYGPNDKDRLLKAFKWLTRTGAGRYFPGTPIGWYQNHQIAAIDALIARAKAQGISNPIFFRVSKRIYQAQYPETNKWISLELSPTELFRIADQQTRSK